MSLCPCSTWLPRLYCPSADCFVHVCLYGYVYVCLIFLAFAAAGGGGAVGMGGGGGSSALVVTGTSAQVLVANGGIGGAAMGQYGVTSGVPGGAT